MEKRSIVFRAKWWLVAAFYGVLIAWTLISVPLILGKAPQMDRLLLAMIVFFISFTWYWSLGLVYGIEIEDEQTITLKRFRGHVHCLAADLRRIEAPPSRIEIGFLRFRFAKQTYYAFYNYSESLKGILTTLKSRNPGIQFVKFSPGYFSRSYT